MEPLRIGLVGLGTMGRGHLEKEQGLDEARIVAVADVVRGAVDEMKAHGSDGRPMTGEVRT